MYWKHVLECLKIGFEKVEKSCKKLKESYKKVEKSWRKVEKSWKKWKMLKKTGKSWKKVERIFQNMLSQYNKVKKLHLKPNQATKN